MRDIIASMIVWLSGHSWLNLTFSCSPRLSSLSYSLLSVSLVSLIGSRLALILPLRLFILVPATFPFAHARLCLSPLFSRIKDGSQTHPTNPRRTPLCVPYQHSMPLNCFLTGQSRILFYNSISTSPFCKCTGGPGMQCGQGSENKISLIFLYGLHVSL